MNLQVVGGAAPGRFTPVKQNNRSSVKNNTGRQLTVDSFEKKSKSIAFSGAVKPTLANGCAALSATGIALFALVTSMKNGALENEASEEVGKLVKAKIKKAPVPK